MRFFRRGSQPDRTEGNPEQKRHDPAAVYADLRGIPLGEHGGPTQPFEGTPIIAVILDWGRANGTATIAAMADGTTSLYTSTGYGVIGAGAHPPVREANRHLMQTASDHLDEFAPTTATPVPDMDRLAIVIRTSEGLRRVEVAYEALKRGTAPGQAVFDAANDVMTAVRVAAKEQEGAG